ncbi:MAG: 2Fe-2S iron-sulfur cluster-binding protein, partial [Clostridia bacterium]
MESSQYLSKKTLLINGEERTVLIDGTESLADVLRKQLGLTGTKVGCRANQCGICAVLLDG